MKLGVCGERLAAIPPRSNLSTPSGLDYVSCSPFRADRAVFAAAQASLSPQRKDQPSLRKINQLLELRKPE
ncbi:MAG: hypothetical protein R3C42_07010 [Parvularculaceae bacterium]